ncbi:hypothetical protein BN14_10261 [Rhizoctonia solani AG-1 IB]|uniref:Uncharacterized protein n=1 Tax=Thanatephorus cucumeris (strain AG1-IB / isolate 7/3/14) TaxID=1108050 RepID=M5C9R6_THACB|nr:hypothetical protein BN14_10261 [Rhizoctonia solani AG-1 IB]
MQFVFQKDRNENDPNADIEMVDAIGYGRLNFILVITLPQDDHFRIENPVTHVLAHVTEAKDVEGDATKELLSFIKGLAGRVFTKGRRSAGEWVIVDRTPGLEQTNFQVEEHAGDDEEGWGN